MPVHIGSNGNDSQDRDLFIDYRPPDRRNSVSDHQWEVTKERAEVLKELSILPLNRRARAVRAAADKLGLHCSTIYRNLAKFEGKPSDLIAAAPGSPLGTIKVSPEVRDIIYRYIDNIYLKKQKPSLNSVVKAIREECERKLLQPPAYSTVQRILSRYDQLIVARKRGEKDKIEALELTPGTYDVTDPMSVWQIDHTLLDVIIVSELDRRPLGRAWLTIVIHVASRMVAGICLTFESPSAHSVARALTHAVTPKDAYLAALGIDGTWPVHGRVNQLSSDNGSEFAKSRAYRRGCDDRFIHVVLRPPGKPRYGGHVERLIGSMMGRAKLLPGATFSNPKQRGTYNSEKSACLTLYEVERWLVEQILDYHNTRHSKLGRSPLQTWDALCEERHIVPEAVEDLDDFYRDFLPIVTKRIGKKGISYQTLEFTGDALAELKRRGEETAECRIDPSDLSCIFVKGADGRYRELWLNYPGAPRVTEWEVRGELLRRRRAGEGASNCALTIQGVLRQRAALAEGLALSKGDRKHRERLHQLGISLAAPDLGVAGGSRWRVLMGEGAQNG